jgi:glutathione S-transferase
MVPVLIDGDFVLWESNSICRYLARKAGRHDLLPAEPQACANVERWMDWQATEFNNAWRYVFPALWRKNPDFNDPERIAAGIKSGTTASPFWKANCSASLLPLRTWCLGCR